MELEKVFAVGMALYAFALFFMPQKQAYKGKKGKKYP